MKATICFAVVILSLGFSSSLNAAFRVVALPGQQAPDTPSGAVFEDFVFRFPAFNNLSQTAFQATLRLGAGGVDGNNRRGIWSEGGGSLALVARTGFPAPGTPSGVQFDINSNDNTVILNDSGQVAFDSLLKFGVNDNNNQGIWSNASGALALVAREGNPAPGLGAGVNYGNFGSLVFNNSGETAFFNRLQNGSGGVTTNNDVTLWKEVGGVPALVTREGSQAPGTPAGANFSGTLTHLTLSTSGSVTFTAGLQTGTGGVTTTNDSGVWTGPVGGLTLVAREGSQAPGTPVGVNFGAFQSPTMNDAGRNAFIGTLAVGGTVTANNDRGIWSDASGSLSLEVREGDAAPGTPAGAVFRDFESMAMNGSGRIAFRGSLQTGSGGVTAANSVGLWSNASGSLSLLARAGEQAPDLDPGALFDDFTGTTVINSSGRIAVQANLLAGTPGVTPTNNRGIWAQDSAGNLRLIVRAGEYVKIAPGESRLVGEVRLIGGTGNQDGRPSGFNDLGEIAFWALLADPSGGASQGIFVTDGRVPSFIPEPSSIVICVLFGIATSLNGRRRHQIV